MIMTTQVITLMISILKPQEVEEAVALQAGPRHLAPPARDLRAGAARFYNPI